MVPNIGSPGDIGPIVIDPNAPVIRGDSLTAAPFFRLSMEGPAAIGADLNDPTDPAQTIGVPLDISDNDTPLNDLNFVINSSNQAVVPDANLVLSGSGADRLLTITPVGIGFATIVISAADPGGLSGSYQINYAVSDATIVPASSRFHGDAADGSTAIAIDADHMWIANDEDQTLRLYNRQQSGMPIKSINFNDDLGSDIEIDLEGSFQNGDAIYWMGSHTNISRSVILGTTLSESGSNSTLTYFGEYGTLREDLITWDETNGHGLGISFLGLNTSLEIEGLALDPNNPDGALVAFRGPLVDARALIVPVVNFQLIVTDNQVPNSAIFGDPILMDLEGHSIRSMECNENGCLIIGGPAGTTNDYRLFTWSGDPEDTPELRAVNLDAQANGSSIEGIVGLPAGAFLGSDGDMTSVQLLIDAGTFDYYGDGTEAKDLPEAEWKKCRTELVTLGSVEIPPIADAGDVVINEIMQNPSAVSDANGEWFELYNNTNGSIDINGWTISDNDSDEHTINNSGPLVIPAGGYLILGNNADQASNGGLAVDYQYNLFTLSNSADELVLTTPDLVEVDRVEWDGGPDFPAPEGASISLLAVNLDNTDGTNWCEATTPYGDGDFGTPAAPNDCPPPPTQIYKSLKYGLDRMGVT